MNLEAWVCHLLTEICAASEKGENYDLHLESEAVDEIAKEYEQTEWIELY